MSHAALLDPVEVMLSGPTDREVRVGLLVPTSGTLGMIGASALLASRMAAYEINRGGGLAGKELDLVLIDAGAAVATVAADVDRMIEGNLVDVFVGFHTSDVHRILERTIRSRRPYVFTPPHEGGRRSPGVVLSGESPTDQLTPALQWLSRERHPRRWALIGNDYIWPRAVDRAAAPIIADLGAQVLYERLVPFGLGADRAGALVDELRESHAEAALLNVVGRDLVEFNRAFAESGLDDSVVRLSCALEENGLLAAGGDVTGGMYASMRTFERQTDGRVAELAGRLRALFGPEAPVLDAYSVGCYDGLHLVAALARIDSLSVEAAAAAATHLLRDRQDPSVTDAWGLAGGRPDSGVRLAHADGLNLDVVASFGP